MAFILKCKYFPFVFLILVLNSQIIYYYYYCPENENIYFAIITQLGYKPYSELMELFIAVTYSLE